MLAALLRRNPAPEPEYRAPDAWGTWPGDGSVNTWAGTRVTTDGSLQLLTVYGCVRLITDAVSTLPLDAYTPTSDGTLVNVAAPEWVAHPKVDLSFTEWVTQVLTSLLLAGNAYVVVMRNVRGEAVEAIPLDPVRVNVERQRGQLAYRIDGVLTELEVRHVKGLMLPGADVGLSPVEMARQSIGLGLAATEYGARFFDGEGNMPGVIEIPKRAAPEAMRSLSEAWRRRRSRAGRGLPGVLDDGAQWKPTGVTNEQAQFLATRKFTAAEIAGQMFLLDPSDLGIPVEGTSLTYANLEQRNARRVQVTFLPWLVRLEALLGDIAGNRMRFKFNVEGLLRGDTATRYAAYATGITSGFLTVAEARVKEDLPPLGNADGGDASPREIAELIQKIYLGVGVVLTADEARSIANRAGAGLTGPLTLPAAT